MEDDIQADQDNFDSKDCIDEKSEVEEIRSVAIVKKSQFEFPVSFRELQSNTDLKTPPANWLRGQFSLCFPNLTNRQSDITSFIMGYQFPDCIGEVDIVSDAENIKKLLKMAYKPNTHLSMMVHRIGNTLLIDEFDIYKYLLRQSEKQWKWLRKFFYTHILESLSMKEDNVLVKPNKTRDVVQSKNLLSKFLYHSVEEDKLKIATQDTPKNDRPVSLLSPTKDNSFELPVEECFPHSPSSSFTRNVIWKFEDLCMLIGTDLPIFGGRTHPCVSLRLKDMDKPISILTGIDYWLDNLMCNVPEVIMCYHQNGIVQKYELVKTEDLPHMPGSQFSTQLVTDIAHNILSFLKTKATKEGHTYWLFKGKDDDIVKLYDLTSLYNEDDIFESFANIPDEDAEEENMKNEANPFTIPVALLFYYVAKNIWQSKDDEGEVANKLATIRNLLENALSLLDKERKPKYFKIFANAHLILSDVFLPQDFDPDSPDLKDVKKSDLEAKIPDKMKPYKCLQEEKQLKIPAKSLHKDTINAESTPVETPESKTSNFNTINLASLCRKRGNKRTKHKTSDHPAKLSKNVYERCNEAMKHVIEGLESVSSYTRELNSSKSTTSDAAEFGKDAEDRTPEPEKQRFAKPFVPIPMPYESLSKKAQPERDKESKEFKENELIQDRKADSTTTIEKTQETELIDPPQPSSSTKSKNANKKSKMIVKKIVLTKSVINSQLKDATWVEKIQFQLLRKASLVYMTKGRIELDAEQYGSCLRCAKLSLRSWCCMLSFLNPEIEFPLPTQPLLLAGDAYYGLARIWDEAPFHIESFNTLSQEMIILNDLLDDFVPGEDWSWMIRIPSDSVDSLLQSYKMLEIASEHITSHCGRTLATTDRLLLRKIGGICNELGCAFMKQANEMCQELNGGIKSGGDLWEQSWKYLEKALSIFLEVEDRENLALIHSNRGRYLRLYAYHSLMVDDHLIYNDQILDSYERANEEYECALEILNKNRLNNLSSGDFVDSVKWEYSTSLFSFASIIHDTISNCEEEQDDVVQCVANIYNKCLGLCDKSGSRELLYQYRAGVVHVRLAAIYHKKYRRRRDTKMFHLSETHYKKAALQFLRLDSSPSDVLKVHLDHAVLLSDLIEGTSSLVQKWKFSVQILELLMACQSGLSLIQKQKKERKEEKENEQESDDKGSEKENKDIIDDTQDKIQTSDSNEAKKPSKDKETNDKIEEKRGTFDKKCKEDSSKCHDEDLHDLPPEEIEVLVPILELFEKKLNSTLLVLLKLSKSGNKAMNSHEAEVRKMYGASLNKKGKGRSIHLLDAVTVISPSVQTIRPIN